MCMRRAHRFSLTVTAIFYDLVLFYRREMYENVFLVLEFSDEFIFTFIWFIVFAPDRSESICKFIFGSMRAAQRWKGLQSSAQVAYSEPDLITFIRIGNQSPIFLQSIASSVKDPSRWGLAYAQVLNKITPTAISIADIRYFKGLSTRRSRSHIKISKRRHNCVFVLVRQHGRIVFFAPANIPGWLRISFVHNATVMRSEKWISRSIITVNRRKRQWTHHHHQLCSIYWWTVISMWNR